MRPMDVVAESLERFNAHDVDRLTALYDRSARISTPLHPEVVDLKQHWRALDAVFAAFPDIVMTDDLSVGDDRLVTSSVTLRGTHHGPLELPVGTCHPPTGRAFEVKGMVVQVVDASSGLISFERTTWEVGLLLAQLAIDVRLRATS